MTTGMDIHNTSDARKTAIVNNELLRLKVDIAARHVLLVKAPLEKKILRSFGMVSLLTNLGNMVLAFLSRISFYSMWKLDLVATNALLLFVYKPRKEHQLFLAYMLTRYMLINKIKMYFIRK